MKKLSTEEVIFKFEKTHQKRYNYDLIDYKNFKTKVKIKCNIHGIFEQTPVAHIGGQGCPKCGMLQTISKIRKPLDVFIRQANKKHNYKFDYSKTQYVNDKEKIIIICPTHGEFKQVAGEHLHYGCRKCAVDKRTLIKSTPKQNESLLDNYPKICEEWSTKNNSCPSQYKKYSGQKVWWKCKNCNNEWKTRIIGRTKFGTSCPKCKSSLGEKEVKRILEKHQIKHKPQFQHKDCKDIKCLKFDFAIWIDGKLGLIEYNGKQHYELAGGYFDCKEFLKDRKKKDKIKINFCKTNKIPLLVIPYTQFKNLEVLVCNFIKEI